MLTSDSIFEEYELLREYIKIRFKDKIADSEEDPQQFEAFIGNSLDNLRLSYSILRLAEVLESWEDRLN